MDTGHWTAYKKNFSFSFFCSCVKEGMWLAMIDCSRSTDLNPLDRISLMLLFLHFFLQIPVVEIILFHCAYIFSKAASTS